MKNAVRSSIVAVLLVIVAAPQASASIAPDLVKGTSLFEGYGAGTHVGSRRLFAWSNESGRRGSGLTGFAEGSGGTLTHMNARHTQAYVGTFDPGTDRVVFQQVRRDESDLFVYDIGQRSRAPLRRLNDGHWQWNPSIDTHRGTTWITYGVNRFGSPAARWRFYLFNAQTGERTLLDETTNRCGCLFPGTIAYPWVTWAVGEDATAWRYDIRTGERTPLLPTDRDEYAVTVMPDGTAFVAQAGDRCGSHAALYRVDPDGTPFLMHELGAGREAANLSVDSTGPHVRLYFDRRNCRTGSADILRLRRAEEIGEPARPAHRTGGGGASGPTRSAATPDATPRTR
jgi:hypothetical protein